MSATAFPIKRWVTSFIDSVLLLLRSVPSRRIGRTSFALTWPCWQALTSSRLKCSPGAGWQPTTSCSFCTWRRAALRSPKNDIVLLDGILDQRIAESYPSRNSDEVFEYLAFEQILKDYDFSREEIE